MNAFHAVNQTLAKLSILVLYYRLFSINRAFTYATYAVGTVQILWFIAVFVERLLVCNPPAKLWNPTLPGKCVNNQIVVAACDTINSLIDFVMIGMAIFMVSKLKIANHKKVQLSILFAIGGL